MLKKSQVLFAILLIIGGTAGTVYAQDGAGEEENTEQYLSTYGLGDQMFLINGGLMVPLFFHNPENGTVTDTNLSLGGIGSLEWNAYLTGNLSLGINLAGMFSISPLGRVLGMVPITAKLSYFFHRYPFEVPIFLGLGVNFISFDEYAYIGPIVKPGAAFYWNFHSEWALGVQLAYWWVPEIYVVENVSNTRFGNFLEISISGLYHFSQ